MIIKKFITAGDVRDSLCGINFVSTRKSLRLIAGTKGQQSRTQWLSTFSTLDLVLNWPKSTKISFQHCTQDNSNPEKKKLENTSSKNAISIYFSFFFLSFLLKFYFLHFEPKWLVVYLTLTAKVDKQRGEIKIFEIKKKKYFKNLIDNCLVIVLDNH